MTLFDEKGARIGTGVMESDNFIKAVEAGERLVQQKECSSFVLHRVVYNSLQKPGNFS